MNNPRPPKPKHGDLQVWWIPQVPMKPFVVPVQSVLEARLILDTLADYDKFQLENDIKPDYRNAGGLNVFDATDKEDGPGGSWVNWYDEDGEEIDDYDLDCLRTAPREPVWKGNANK